MKRILCILCIILSFSITQIQSEEITGKAVSIADGDTITILTKEKQQVKIRFNGIDCPEKSQAFGQKARKFVSETIFGETVRAIVKDKDRYGRTVADVISPEGLNINQSLVKLGLAWWYEKYAPEDTVLRDLEKEARENGRGLWSDPNPDPPWEYRKSPKPGNVSLSPESSNPSASKQSGGDTVYLTKTGSKYHRAGCRSLSKSKIPISLEEAKARYSPFSVCNPPQ